MLQSLFYQEKGTFLQSLHPAVSLTYITVLLLTALVFDHPFYLVSILLATWLAIRAADGMTAWESYLKVALWLALLVMLINPLVNHNGSSVIWYGPALPLFGRFTVTMEAVAFGAAIILVVSATRTGSSEGSAVAGYLSACSSVAEVPASISGAAWLSSPAFSMASIVCWAIFLAEAKSAL
jgi:energy-coupling factor transporter transmembrane protein EcfT